MAAGRLQSRRLSLDPRREQADIAFPHTFGFDGHASRKIATLDIVERRVGRGRDRHGADRQRERRTDAGH